MDEKTGFEGKQGGAIPAFDQVFGDTEQTIRKGLNTLAEWGDQARSMIRNRPGVALASISIAGFMTGLMLRQGSLSRDRANAKMSLTSDPVVVFLTGALAGILLGPRLLREAQESSSDLPFTQDNISELDPSRRGSAAGAPPEFGHH